mgnify:CR=1 FL=1
MQKNDSASVTKDANRTYRKMTEEAVAPLVVKLGVPTMLSMLVTALYSTASTYYVSYLGTSAVGAMGVVFALQTIIQAIGIMIGQGCAAQTSRLLGARDYPKANTLASSGLFLSLLVSSVFALCAWAALKTLLSSMGATETILPYARIYAEIILLACPFMAASYTLNNLLRSEGLAIVGMMGLGAGGVLNIAVAPLFIFVFDWGIAGAAWANALCQFISFGILLSHYWRGRGSMHMHWAWISKSLSLYGSIFKNGLPSLTRNLLGAVAASVLNLMAGRYGDAGVAAMSIVGQVMMMTNAFLIGLGQGFQPVLGYNWGAKLFDRVKKALDVTIAMGAGLMVILGLLGFVFAGEIVGFFEVNDPEVMNIGVLALRLQCSVAIIVPVNVIGNMAFQVIGRTAIGTLLAATRQGLFFLPLIMVLPGYIGLLGIQSAQPIAEVLSFFVCGFFLWHFRKEVANRIIYQ